MWEYTVYLYIKHWGFFPINFVMLLYCFLCCCWCFTFKCKQQILKNWYICMYVYLYTCTQHKFSCLHALCKYLIIWNIFPQHSAIIFYEMFNLRAGIKILIKISKFKFAFSATPKSMLKILCLETNYFINVGLEVCKHKCIFKSAKKP